MNLDLSHTALSAGAPRDAAWRMTQTWHNLLFAHWPVAPSALAHLVPPGLEIDTFGGHAWLGVVAFRLSHIRLRGLPEVPFVSGFPEVNVRTYVRHAGRPGVLFLSLDTDHRITIAMARPWFRLPYRYAEVEFEETYGGIRFESRRHDARFPDAEFEAVYGPCSAPFAALPGSLEHWLTERYCYFAPARGRLYRCDIDHRPWLLQRARGAIARNTMARSHGVELPDAAPLLLYAHYMKSLIWPVRRTSAAGSVPGKILSPLPAWA